MDNSDQENERMLASVAMYLKETGQLDYAVLVTQCRIDNVHIDGWSHPDDEYRGGAHWVVEMTGPVNPHEEHKNNSPFNLALQQAFQAILGEARSHPWEEDDGVVINIRIGVTELDENWRDEIIASARKKANNHNRNVRKEPVEKPYEIWSGMEFNSPGELAIAKALDQADVLYFPNDLARVTIDGKRANRYPDFLILYKGRWGVLEVDGKQHNDPGKEYQRDRYFQRHGIKVITHYPHTRCANDPAGVVKDFLELLDA
jgi:hypothetical protein